MAAQFRVSEVVSLGGRVLASWARNREFTPQPSRAAKQSRKRECTHRQERGLVQGSSPDEISESSRV